VIKLVVVCSTTGTDVEVLNSLVLQHSLKILKQSYDITVFDV
jgi:hypothetical protein